MKYPPTHVALGSLAVVLLLVAVYGVVLYSSVQEQEITVEKMWTKYHDGDEKYLVSDTNGNVYSIEDSVVFLKFDASDRWGQLDVGKTYTVTTVWYRVTYFSWYPNIVEIEVV